MDVFRQPDEVRAACDAARARGERVGLVPTMGALHAGHLALVAAARRRCDFVVTSIFVNPTQFGPNEDFGRYPRMLDADVAKCHAAGSHVFAPANESMYPPGDETRVRVGATAAALCGEHRPGHFEGVATVVTKLFALVGPAVAVFGRKDYQQLQVLRRVARDLFLPIEIIGLPTVREADGLALSSRNAYLSEPERARALALPRALAAAHAAFAAGERRAERLADVARTEVERAPATGAGTTAVPVRIDYVTLADADSVVPFGRDATVGERAVLALAVRVGSTRLIDNTVLGEDAPPSPTPPPEPPR